MQRIPLLAVLGLALATPAFAETPAAAPPPAAISRWDGLMNDSVRALKNNQLATAVDLCEQARVLAASFGPADTHLSRSLVLRAEIYLWQKDNARAEQTFAAAVTSCERAVGPNHPDVVHPLASLANYYYYVAKRCDRVAPIFERILAIVEQASPRDDRQVIMWSRNLGMIYQQLGDFARAEPHFAAARTLAARSAPAWISHEALNSAAFYRAWGRLDRAESLAREALAQREQALAAQPGNVDAKLDLAVALDELAAIELAAARLAAAERDARRSLTLVETFMTSDQPDRVPRLLGLAKVLRAERNFTEASELYRQALAITEKNLGPDSVETAGVLGDYAAVLRELKQADTAAALEARAAAIRQRASTS